MKTAGIIVEHPASSEENPVYILDRILMKTDFTDEFIELIGNEYVHYDEVAKQVLNLVYLCTKYNHKSIKASEITPDIYLKIYGKVIVAKTYETLGRKTRSICNNFLKQGIFNKGQKNDYSFNFEFNAKNSLFK